MTLTRAILRLRQWVVMRVVLLTPVLPAPLFIGDQVVTSPCGTSVRRKLAPGRAYDPVAGLALSPPAEWFFRPKVGGGVVVTDG